MHKSRWLVAFLSVVLACAVVGAASASVGENFAAAGVVVGGSAGLSASLGSFASLGLSSFTMWLSPTIGLLLADNVSVDASASLNFQHRPYDSSGLWPQWSIASGLGATYYLVGNRDAYTGAVTALSATARFSYYGGGSSGMYLTLYPQFVLYYFITDRIAPYLSLSGLGVGLSLQPSIPVYAYSWLSPQLSVGMSVWLPSAARVLFVRR